MLLEWLNGLGLKTLGRSTTGVFFTPTIDGEGILTASLENQSVEIRVAISGQDEIYQPDFITEVNPVISKLGCNAQEPATVRKMEKMGSNFPCGAMTRYLIFVGLPMIWHREE